MSAALPSAPAQRLPLDSGASTALRVDAPAAPWAAYVFAHGAGAGMDHVFMAAVAQGLAARGVACLRFQFPFMDRGGRRPDPPPVAQATVRAAVGAAAAQWPGLPLFAGGKSFGARMSSQAQAEAPLQAVRGLVFVGFPLHPAGKPGTARADHLAQVALPMLFIQGSRDALAAPRLVREVARHLGSRATLHMVDAADHSFQVLVRSGRTADAVLAEVLDTAVDWMRLQAR